MRRCQEVGGKLWLGIGRRGRRGKRWYDNPVWPDTEGLEELRKRGLARHAKWWRGPEGCEGKVSV